MQTFTVKKLAKLSGVTIRTLHYYDQIGLLCPAIRTEKKYRLYGNDELLRLQQILFFRELDFTLKDIKDIMDDPGYDLIEALKQHKTALLKRKKRISTLLKTIDKTINNLKNGKIMKNPKELYEGFPEEVGTIYKKEAVKKYGKETVEQSEKELMKLGKSGIDALNQEMSAVFQKLFELRSERPNDDKVQQQIAHHYEVVRKFWGTSNSMDNQADAYTGLGDLYVSDDRYLAHFTNGDSQPEFARFMQKAMKHFAENRLN